MGNCVACPLFQIESDLDGCIQVNRPGGRTITEELINQLDTSSDTMIVDIACGLGWSMRHFAEQGHRNLVGLDLSHQILLQGRELYPVGHRIQGDCGEIPVRDQSIEIVLMECALSLSGDSMKILAEFHRILKPGGRLLISDIYLRDDPPTDQNKFAPSNTRCFGCVQTKQEINSRLHAQSFVITFWKDYSLLLKEWIAKMIFKLGSIDHFYECVFKTDVSSIRDLNRKRDFPRLGYFAAVAEKPTDPTIKLGTYLT